MVDGSFNWVTLHHTCGSYAHLTGAHGLHRPTSKIGYSMTDKPIKILLQTTIPTTEDDWSIARFGMLGAFLGSQRGADGRAIFDVTMRDRDPLGRPDTVL